MELYKQVFWQLPQPALLLDKCGRVEDFNAFAGDVFGVEGPEPNRENLDLLATRVPSWLAEELYQFAGSGVPSLTFEKEFSVDDVLSRFFRVRLADRGDTAGGTIVILTDITERRRTLEEIDRLATIVNCSEDAIMSVSLEYVIQSVNQGAVKIYGYSKEELVGESLFRIVPDDMVAEVRAILDKAASGEATSRHETKCRDKYGRCFPIAVTYSPVERGGKISGVSCISRDISQRRKAEDALRRSHMSLSTLLDETVKALSMVLEKRDIYTSGHQRRVSRLAELMARSMGLDSGEVDAIVTASLLHDIGKICIPMAILSRPARLSPGERALVQDHPQSGLDILRNIPFAMPVGTIIHQHHERMDGSGYPKGLSGNDILLGSRIVAVADVLEAMSSHRPYRPALGIEVAMAEFEEHKGTRYDSDVVEVMCELVANKDIIMKNGELITCR